MMVNVEVIMTPEEMKEAKEILKENSDFYDSVEALIFEWVETNFVDYIHHFDIKIKESKYEYV